MTNPTEDAEAAEAAFRVDLSRVLERARSHPISRNRAGLILCAWPHSKRVSRVWQHIIKGQAHGFTVNARGRVVLSPIDAAARRKANGIDIAQTGRVALGKLPSKVYRACREEAWRMADSAGLEGSDRGSYLRAVTAVLAENEARKLASYPRKPSKRR